MIKPQMTTLETIRLFEQELQGHNYSANSVRAYSHDVTQFTTWIATVRVDWNNPLHFTRSDIVEFMHVLAVQKLTGVTRVRKLAAIRHYFTFLKETGITLSNPAETVKGARREEKDPAVLYKNEYKALLFEASGNSRDYAILQVFLQCGLRVSELVSLKRDDVDIENRNLVVRQGKGRKDRTIPLEDQALKALKAYLKERSKVERLDTATLFLAKNGTSLDVRSVRYLVTKLMKKAGIKKSASVHTLRHTFGTHKVDKGMPIPALKVLLGHRKMETTYKYVHLAQTTLRTQQQETAL